MQNLKVSIFFKQKMVSQKLTFLNYDDHSFTL